MKEIPEESAALSPRQRELFHGMHSLSPEQQALVAARLKSSGLGRLDLDRVPRRSPGLPAPLSFAQQRLWFLHRLAPGSTAYNMPLAVRLRGLIDVRAMQQAVEAIVARHEALRTTIRETEQGPVQIIAPTLALPLEVTDLTERPTSERGTEARRLAGKEARTPFDLARGPLVRTRLLRLAEREHVLLITLHHIVSDGWSMGLLFNELATLYTSFLADTASPLPDLPIQYPDFAAWQRQRLGSESLRRELAYWKQQLEGAPAVLMLPTDRPRPPVSSFLGATASVKLPPDLCAKLNALSRHENATLFMTMLAAFQILIARYTAQDDVLVGTPIAGRTRAELEDLIGCFLNTLVLRTDLSGDPSFQALLARTREVALQAYANQELPFERLVEELQPERSLSYNPLFQVLFQLENTPRSGQRLEGLDVSRFRISGISAKFDLSLRIRGGAGDLAVACTYSTDLFDADTIAHLLEQYVGLLQQIVVAPQARIHTYSLVSEGSRALLPDPRAALATPTYPNVLDEFAKMVAGAPGNLAIKQAGRSWTYAELAAATRRIAAAVEALGVERGEVVGVTGPSSFGLVAGMLAILSSGGVMLPIAEDLPDLRKRRMLQEAGARHLLGVAAGGAPVPWAQDLDSVLVLGVERDTGHVVGYPGTVAVPRGAPVSPRAPADPAYIFFTSGTTGTPKGILGTHQGLSHFLAWQRGTFGIAASDRCAQLTNISFDVVLRDLFLPLTSGGTLCLPPEQLSEDAVLDWLASEDITVLHAVPSRSQAWLNHGSPDHSLQSLRCVFLAGELLTDTLVRQWRAVAGECEVVNLYGPTEATMVKCFYRVPSKALPGVQPVGHTLPETQALVLSSTGRMCAVSELGEVVLRTPFRTRGYVNAPEEQSQRFVANPFRHDPQDVLYRTGDLGRYRADGTLMVLARLDHQVKIRGVRVEPDEVTAVLARHPRVGTCAVVARVDDARGTALVAYVVPSETGLGPAELRAYLAERLPAPLIPSTFVFLDRLPLTSNGKLDRGALPAPWGADCTGQPYVGPRTPIETMLAEIWTQVLGVPRVGIHDDFFALGGHSLLATQVIARARRDLRVELSLRGLFEAPTVAALALSVTRDLIGQDVAERSNA